ncbi:MULTISPECIES: ABC transporter ATP-binding protein [Sphingomonadaceae]|uniref:Iron ABC transporter ATP-binding protein n=1 Tax=Sphingomonas sanxanigenens DSM 19645 = NX02 TaxID=1123269 RepID=W0AD26_9SPHN|nr:MULTISPECIES: ATP-binding cassette domain-containing protein [Sphingomonadaceae]AHE53570.1 iron ABC transporter ATP-binding protein [Sphingomonas sanxanigenens DSM 19645 = NX02]OAN53365.1 ABC transporter ATP-binding protein [Sphingobium sp. TCM1]
MSAPSTTDSDDAPIRVSGLRTAFGEKVIHEDLDLEVRRGEILGVVGGSGSGKSVLLNTILGLKRPDGGTVEIFGRHIDDPGAQADIERRIGVMFQQGALFSFLTVEENVETPLLEHAHLSRDFVRDLARLKIKLAGLPDDAGILKPAELSGGMRKRAGVARAIALDPEILFLDEPTAGLDPIAASEFDDLVRTLRDALGFTVFMITHDLDTLYAICDRVAVVADRKIVAIAPVAELERSDHPWIRRYFLGPRGRAAKKQKEG